MKKLLYSFLTLFFIGISLSFPSLSFAACDPNQYDSSKAYSVNVSSTSPIAVCKTGDCQQSGSSSRSVTCWPAKVTSGSLTPPPATQAAPRAQPVPAAGTPKTGTTGTVSTQSAQPVCTLDKDGFCTQINTSIGPINPDPVVVITKILGILLGLSGGIFLLLTIRAGYRLITSAGNPEAIKEARESLTSAIVGFLFLIFSFVILEMIGVDILQIPGFAR